MSKASKKKGRVTGEEVELRQKITSSEPSETSYKQLSMQLQNEINERKQAEEELEEHLRFERLVSMISGKFISTQASQVDIAIKEGLKLVGEFFDVDRVSIGQIVGGKEEAQTTCIWLSDEYDAQVNVLAYESVYPNVASYLKRNDAFVYGSLDDFPSDWTEERQVAIAVGIKAGVIVRLNVGGDFLGAISVNSLRAERIWPDEIIQRLRFIGEIFANILNRKGAQAALRESEEIYRSLVENVDFGITIINADHNVVMANATVGRWFDKSPDEFVGKKCYRVFEKNDHPCSPCPGVEAMATGRPCEIESEGIRDDGTRFVIKDRAFPYYGLNGEIVGFHEMLEDITERKQAENELAETTRLLEAIINTTHMMAVYLDPQFNFIRVNPSYAASCKHDVSFFPGKNHFDLYPHEENQAIFQRVVDTGEPIFVSAKPFVYPDQPERGVTYWDWSLIPTKASDGKVNGLVLTLSEVTERIRGEDRLIEARELAEAANIAKSQFLANMSHEIRTPMSVIMGFADILCKEELTDEQKSYTKLISGAGKSLLRIIDEILDVSRIEAGKLEIEIAECSLGKLVDGIEVMMRPAAREIGLQFDVFRSGILPATILTDSDRVRQCLINLIGNAIKFTNNGHVYLKVSVAERTNGSFVRFDVEDTGVGIAADRHESIFKPFEQVNGSDSLRQGGAGLGLTITRQLAQLLGGDLSLASEVGKGSVFSLVIPAGVDAEPSSLMAEDEEVRGIGSGLVRADSLTFSGKVLVAEDSQGNQILVERILKRYGLEVVVVDNGKEAVEQIPGGGFDLILMDIQMPGLNGLEATKKLREEGITTPIIALTAFAMAGDREKCLEAGCDDYLSKPIDRDMLHQILNKYVGQGKNVG